MALTVLLQTGRVAAEATVERLQALAINAQVIDRPNAFVRLSSGGNYRVRVAVPEEELERARAEIARWEVEAAPRVAVLAKEVQRGLVLASLPALAFAVVLVALRARSHAAWGGVLALWIACVAVWVWRSGRTRGDARGG